MEVDIAKIVNSILESVASKAVLDTLKKITLNVDKGKIELSLQEHMQKVASFSSDISFREMKQEKSIGEIYVPLDLKLDNSSSINENNESDERYSSDSVIQEVLQNTTENLILIGSPGAGKTTTLKHICQELLTNEEFISNLEFPILVRFRDNDFNEVKDLPLHNYLFRAMGLEVLKLNSTTVTKRFSETIEKEDYERERSLLIQRAVRTILSTKKALIVLDGLDEISIPAIKSMVLDEIEEISLSSVDSKFILTTRVGDDKFSLPHARRYLFAKLSDVQMELLVRNWLKEGSEIFIRKIKQSKVYDFSRRPLLIAHLCAIFEKDGRIPDKPKSIYKKSVDILIEDWNQENRIERYSKYSTFVLDRKRDFLENIAFELTFAFNMTSFSFTDLEKCYKNICESYDLPIHDCKPVIEELIVDNGLITKSGHDKYEFAHKSFQEYLCANYIIRLPTTPPEVKFYHRPEIVAMVCSLSANPTEQLSIIIERHLLNNVDGYQYLHSLFGRLKLESPNFRVSYKLGLSLIKLFSNICRSVLSFKERRDRVDATQEDFPTFIRNLSIIYTEEDVVPQKLLESMQNLRFEYVEQIRLSSVLFFSVSVYKDEFQSSVERVLLSRELYTILKFD